MTNALRHALPGSGHTRPRRPVRLGLLQQGPWVLCAVADPGTAVPVPRTPGSLDETGRGLQMICAFSDLWGCTTPSQAGKVVWALFYPRQTPPSPAQVPSRPGRDRIPNLTTRHNQPVERPAAGPAAAGTSGAGLRPSSTGHVWITIWCRYGCDRRPDRPAAPQVTRICAANPRAGPSEGSPGMPPGIAPPSWVFAQFIHKLVHTP